MFYVLFCFNVIFIGCWEKEVMEGVRIFGVWFCFGLSVRMWFGEVESRVSNSCFFF